MSKQRKFLIAFLGITVLFFGAIVFRVWGAKPPSVIKVNPIPVGSEYDPTAWAPYYPLQYTTWQ